MEENNKKAGTGFTLALLVISAAIFAMSFQMFAKTSFDLSGYGGIPVIISLSMILFLVMALLEDRGNSKNGSDGEKEILPSASRLITKDIAVFLGMVVGYCAALGVGIPFLLSTPIFLFGAMQYLMQGYWRGNLIYTILVTAGIYVIFVMIFHVSLP